MKKTINIAKDFGRYPYGRLRKYHETSGESFREDILIPVFREYGEITVELDGTEGYGSSFLDEAFAGLIRVNKLEKAEILRKLRFISNDDPSIIDEILGYIQQA